MGRKRNKEREREEKKGISNAKSKIPFEDFIIFLNLHFLSTPALYVLNVKNSAAFMRQEFQEQPSQTSYEKQKRLHGIFE